MKLSIRVFSVVLAYFLSIAGTAFGADTDKAKKQAEVSKATQVTMERFYKANPKLKGDVAKAPGYAVFTTYGFSFILGGAGGHGVARDPKTSKNTYMSMAQASVGVQIGAAQTDTLIIFKSAAALTKFVDKGWEFGGGGGVEAGAGGKTATVPGTSSSGENIIADAFYYTLTKNGLQAGGAVAGTKFWKDKDLN
jgi:lipid-binding SYLF domain-containing protein